jgi:CRP/FNR family cyclic AMP-dependent transcriptional regulator
MLWTVAQEQINEFFPKHVTQFRSKGSVIFTQDSPADVLYWLKKGIVELSRVENKGKRFLARLVGPTEIFGFAEIDERGEAGAIFEARARLPCELVMLTRQHVLNVFQRLDGKTLTSAIVQLNKLWSEQALCWASFVLMDCRERLTYVLIDLARRFGTHDERGTLIVLDLTHQDLAEMVGFSRALTSRVIGELLNDGLLIFEQSRYVLPNRSELAHQSPHR